MGKRHVALCLLSAISAAAQAEPKIDIHGLVQGAEGARFIKGIPTLELPLEHGAVQIRPLGFNHNDTVFAVAVFNAGSDPANIALEDMRATVAGQPVRIWTGRDLARQAKNRAMWAQLGIAFISAAGSALAASQQSIYRSTYSTRYGSYSYRSTYPSLAGQLLAYDIAREGAFSMALVQQRLDLALANIDDSVVQRTTVDPGRAYGAIVVVDRVDYHKAPIEMKLSIKWNGEEYPFSFLLTKQGQPEPPQYTARLAENTRPVRLDHRWGQPAGAAGTTATDHGGSKVADGAVVLPSGAIKVPAKTKSGFCLELPDDYVATGDLNYPVVSGAMPRCQDMGKEVSPALWKPLH